MNSNIISIVENMINTVELNKLIEKSKDLPKQGTKEWLDAKKYRIGGSEIATILNKNPYQKTKDLIEYHTDTKKFNNNIAVYWGRMFESILQDYINDELKCKINEFGSIPHKKYNNIAYSPDGLAIVHRCRLNNFINVEDLTRYSLIVLFEFKCPYSRIPSGSIPDYYLPQPKLGLDVIEICDLAIFTEAVFRLCKLDDLDYANTNYNHQLHSKCTFDNIPIDIGYIIIYYDKLEFTDEMNETFLKNIELLGKISDYIDKKFPNLYNEKYDLYDIGADSNYYVANTIFEYIFNHSLFMVDKNKGNTNLNERCEYLKNNNHSIFGVIPYKLMKLYNNRVDRDVDPTFITENMIEKINKIVDVIKDCDNKSYIDRSNIIRSYNIE